jgi:transglutaminase-like putative cysteine protease
MLLHIRHETRYRYKHPVHYSIQNLRLTPRDEAGQSLRQWQVRTPVRCRPARDAWGNMAHMLTLTGPHEEIHIGVDGVVETVDTSCTGIADDARLPIAAWQQETPLTAAGPQLLALAQTLSAPRTPMADFLRALMDAVEARISYAPGTTDVQSTAQEALAHGRGVCQDHAHVLIACARLLGLPARYVSGYLYTGDDGHLASHAWADVWDQDGSRWLSCDATHRRFADERYCRLAVGRDYLDACPVRGVRWGGGSELMDATVLVSAADQ